MRAWKGIRKFSDFQENDLGVCPYCNGMMYVRSGENIYHCGCNMKRWFQDVKISLDPYRSHVEPASFKTIRTPKKANKEVVSLINAVETAMEWSERPSGFLVLLGTYGCGKTHILRSLNTLLSPIALYITAGDFEHNIYANLSTNTLDDYISTVSRAPVLLFDDYGMEYGAKMVSSKFAQVVDFRDRDRDQYPMALATNLDAYEIMSRERVGSRLLSRESKVHNILVGDYRSAGVADRVMAGEAI